MIQIILTILSSSVKFAMTFPLAVMQFKFSFIETILWTNIGGILGIYFFAYLSDKLILWWQRPFSRKRKAGRIKEKRKQIFTKKNRRIVRVKQGYGLIGIALITPLLLSIPVGSFLMVRYYPRSRFKFISLMASNLFWSVIYTLFYIFWDGVLFKQL
jgi:hypothetical protein